MNYSTPSTSQRESEHAGSPSRRQRISMACQYCRHRKIRCCGGAPCRNCTRSQRECEYAPVPEEVNRATREKKAKAKAAKGTTTLPPPPAHVHASLTATSASMAHSISASSSASSTGSIDTTSGDLLSPALSSLTAPIHIHPSSATSGITPGSYPSIFGDMQTFDGPFGSMGISAPVPARPIHRRSSSVPGYEAARLASPSLAQPFRSPPILEHSNWYMNTQAWNAFPSVLEPSHLFDSSAASAEASTGPATPPDSRAGSTELEQQPTTVKAWSSPSLHLRLPPMTMASNSSHSSASVHSPLSPMHYSPFPSPIYTANESIYFASALGGGQHSSVSPTLAPEMPKDSIGLGIGISAKEEMIHTPSYLADEYMAHF